MAYPIAAHIRQPYGGFFVDPNQTAARNFSPLARFVPADVQAEKRVRGALWFVSNCASEERLRVAKELAK